ncbi:MAG: helicase-associated domain-containing protein [Treponema sp.]|jgi:hypothetical protein|nr:helicase-associated domain-containing protein [Treponema sp.]
MKRVRFRSLDDWKSALLMLPDDSYFELMRSVLGNIKTPFSKQRLMDDLVGFLSREAIQNTIAAYIDKTDHTIIAGVALLEEPTLEELLRFFAGEFSYPELHKILINLEERFILYRFPQQGPRRFALNPLLEPVLSPFMADTSPLFPWKEEETSPSAPGSGARLTVDDRVIAALVGFVLEEDCLRGDGGIRKKALDTLRLLFPGLNAAHLLDACRTLGLFQRGEGQSDRLYPHEARLRAFAELSSGERLEYCAAGFYCFLWFHSKKAVQVSTSSQNLQEQVRNCAEFIHQLLDFLEPSRHYPQISLWRFGDLLIREGLEPIQGSTGHPYRLDWMLEALELSGLLEPSAPGWWRLAAHPQKHGIKGPVLAMDTAFSFVLYPELRFEDALSLAFFTVPRESGAALTGVVLRVELTMQSVIRGFDRGMDTKTMLDLLNRVSGNRIPQNLRWTLEDWEQRYAEVSLHQGVVLSLGKERRYLAEAGPLASLVARTLAPGVYLLSVPVRAEAVKVLQKVGVDIIAQRGFAVFPREDATEERPEDTGEGYPVLGRFPLHAAWIPGALHQISADHREVAARAIQEGFRRALGAMAAADQEELHARIERRVIISETQLTGAVLRHENLEARGLDYVGKARIASQAIATQSLIEVLWPCSTGGNNHAVGIPDALEKWGSERVLIIKPVSLGETTECTRHEQYLGYAAGPLKEILRLPLGKISLLRRIKPSIFGS